MDESLIRREANREVIFDLAASSNRKGAALKEIAEIAEDHIDYNTDAWHRVLMLARQALGEGQ